MGETWTILAGDCRATLATLEAGSVQTCVTSPPYFNLRDYGTGEWTGGDATCKHVKGSHRPQQRADRPRGWDGDFRRDGDFRNTGQPVLVAYADVCGKCGAARTDAQIGREPTREAFASAIVEVFREVRRVLADDGTVWLNLGDTWVKRQMQLVPAVVALALQADGWWLRMENIWGKRNGLPDGGAHDRPDYFHEQVYLLSKSERYYFDKDAIREESDPKQEAHNQRYAREYASTTDKADTRQPGNVNHVGIHSRPGKGGRAKRSVWWESVSQFSGAHTAVMPVAIAEPCILAGSREGDTVLDAFAGTGTTGVVALRHNRSFVGCELNPVSVAEARDRIIADSPLLNTHAEAA